MGREIHLEQEKGPRGCGALVCEWRFVYTGPAGGSSIIVTTTGFRPLWFTHSTTPRHWAWVIERVRSVRGMPSS